MSRKAQGASELVIILAVALAVLLVIFVVNTDIMTRTTTRFRFAKATAAVNDIGDASELVYEQGVGSKTRVYLSLPNGISTFTATDKTIQITFRTHGEAVYRNLGFTINATQPLPTKESFYWICIEAQEGITTIYECPLVNESISCGDGTVGRTEKCDESVNNGVPCTPSYGGSCVYCSETCTNLTTIGSYCGDGVLDIFYEECDDGNNVSGDGCESNCQIDVDAPATIASLQNQSAGTSWIFWNWTNPVDGDFSQVIVYLDSVWKTNTSDHYYNATGLNSSALYTIRMHTKDTTGNVNNSDVNNTASTQAIPATWQTIFFDDFNRANNNRIGGSWTESTGTAWDIKSNRGHADDCDSSDKITSDNIDLLGKSNATLTFDWEYANLDRRECLNMDLNDGTGWVNNILNECSSRSNTDASGSVAINLLDHISLTSTVQIRYECINNHRNDEVYVDNVNVTAVS